MGGGELGPSDLEAQQNPITPGAGLYGFLGSAQADRRGSPGAWLRQLLGQPGPQVQQCVWGWIPGVPLLTRGQLSVELQFPFL